MIKYKGLVKAFIVMLLMSVCGLLSGSSCYAASDIPVVQAPDKVQSIRKTDTSIQIRWESIPDVDGYIIYRYRQIETPFLLFGTRVSEKNSPFHIPHFVI